MMPTVTLRREYQIACGHRLSGLRDGHKCMRPHGHNYKIELFLRQNIYTRADDAAPGVRGGPQSPGMIEEAGDLDTIVMPVLSKIDHNVLNDVLDDGTPAGAIAAAQPTAENFALYLWERLGFLRNGPSYKLVRVVVHENDRLCAIVDA
jgi:6-pyruvoyl-tetrahydropterin synthase